MRYVIIGRKENNQLLIVDTQTMTVSGVDASSNAFKDLQNLRADGDSVVRGVDLAIAADARDEASGRWFYS